jgi:rhodanese-related sulfurtransferase
MKRKFITAVQALFIFSTIFAQAEKKDDKITLPLDSFTAIIDRQSNPQIIDARSPEEFAYNHINGSLNFNLQTAGYITFVQALDKSRPVFIYAINTGRSGALAKDLIQQGFHDVHDLAGGIANWIGGGQPYYTSVKKGLSLPEYKNIIASRKTVLVDIGSRYCSACKKVKPILDSLRKENGDAVKIVEIELEESPQLIAALKTVDVFPYLILYEHGEIVLKKSGLDALKPSIDAALAKAK